MSIEKLRVIAMRVFGASLAIVVATFCVGSMATAASRFGPAKPVEKLESRHDPIRGGFEIFETSQRQSSRQQERSFQESSFRGPSHREPSNRGAIQRELTELEQELARIEREIAILLLEEHHHKHKHLPKPSHFR